MANATLDNTINTLKKLREPKQLPKQPDPILKQGKVLDLLWEKMVSLASDTVDVLLRGKYDVVVKNFPHVQKVEITNLEPERDFTPGIITSLEALQRTIKEQPVLSLPQVQRVEVINHEKSEKIEFPLVQKVEITNHPRVEKMSFPKEMDVKVLNTTEITNSIDMMCSMMSKMDKNKKEPLTPENFKEIITAGFKNLSDNISVSLEQNRIREVTVSNVDNFPVTFPIPTFRDVNGQITQAKLDTNGNVKVSLQPSSDALASYLPADSDESTATKYYGFTDPDGKWYILRDAGTNYRYAKGDSGYSTNWTNRASLSYDYYHVTF